jgi:predicted metal-dependent hydrolase
VPRIAPAAVRIPDPDLAQLPLKFSTVGPQIFVHEGTRQALERRLITAHGGAVQLSVTDNRHRMVTRTQSRGILQVRAHMMFLDAPEWVIDALVRYVVHGDRDASAELGEFIASNSHRIRAERRAAGPLRTRGRVHDLLSILDEVNERHFAGGVTNLLITWGRKTRPAELEKRSTIKLGSYSAPERLIRVHPVLDKEWVPRYFVAYIVYHELLHHLIPAVRVAGRAVLHSPEFNRREREFRHYERAIAWERKNIERLLRGR